MAELQKSPHGTQAKDLNAVMTNVEALRVTGCLHKSIEKLQLLSILTYEGFDSADEGGNGAGGGGGGGGGGGAADGSSGVGAILESQRKMEQRYGELLKATATVKSNPLDPSLDLTCFTSIDNKEQRKHQEELQKVSKDLKEYSRDLCRQLKENPNDMNNWNKVVTGRTELITLLQSCAKEMQASSCSNAKKANAQDDMGFVEADTASQAESQKSGRSTAAVQGTAATYEAFAVKYAFISGEGKLSFVAAGVVPFTSTHAHEKIRANKQEETPQHKKKITG